METFTTEIQVRFAHTDPAGILFYPRYFEMLNQVVEDWFEHGLGLSFHELVIKQGGGVPAVHLEADFISPSELGDRIVFSLVVEKLGRSSCTVKVIGAANEHERLMAKLTMVLVSMKERKPKSWPADLRARMAHYVVKESAATDF